MEPNYTHFKPIKQTTRPSPEQSSGVLGGRHPAVFLDREAATAASNSTRHSSPKQSFGVFCRFPINEQKPPLRVFFAASIMMFFLTLSAADSVGFVPCSFDGTCSSAQVGGSASSENLPLSSLPELGSETEQRVVENREPVWPVALPERIVIPRIGLDLPVQNPSTRDIAALDTILKNGPARYVDSAKLGEKGNALIFAHSSRLPVVRNEMYRAFNRVNELEKGDTITIAGEGKSYVYTVRSVRRGDANDEIINLSPTQGTILTLVTCDTLTSKESRWILEAELIGVI